VDFAFAARYALLMVSNSNITAFIAPWVRGCYDDHVAVQLSSYWVVVHSSSWCPPSPSSRKG